MKPHARITPDAFLFSDNQRRDLAETLEDLGNSDPVAYEIWGRTSPNAQLRFMASGSVFENVHTSFEALRDTDIFSQLEVRKAAAVNTIVRWVRA